MNNFYTLTNSWRVMDHFDSLFLQMLLGPDSAQHQQLRGIDSPSRQYHFLLCQHRPLSSLFNELYSVGSPGVRIDEHLGDVRVHGDVKVLPQPYRSKEGLGRAATGTSAHGELVEGETSLFFSVDVPDVVSHFLASFQECYAQGSVVGTVLDRLVTACKKYSPFL